MLLFGAFCSADFCSARLVRMHGAPQNSRSGHFPRCIVILSGFVHIHDAIHIIHIVIHQRMGCVERFFKVIHIFHVEYTKKALGFFTSVTQRLSVDMQIWQKYEAFLFAGS